MLDPDHPPENFDAILSNELGKDIDDNDQNTENNVQQRVIRFIIAR